MKKMTKETLKLSAKNVMIDMSEEEYDQFLSDFDEYQKYIEILENTKVEENVVPMVFPYEILNELKNFDENTMNLTKEELFKNSNNFDGERMRIKRVVK